MKGEPDHPTRRATTSHQASPHRLATDTTEAGQASTSAPTPASAHRLAATLRSRQPRRTRAVGSLRHLAIPRAEFLVAGTPLSAFVAGNALPQRRSACLLFRPKPPAPAPARPVVPTVALPISPAGRGVTSASRSRAALAATDALAPSYASRNSYRTLSSTGSESGDPEHHGDTNLRKLLTRRDLDAEDLRALRDLVRFGVMADDQIARR